ncbi:MAG: RcnB family protein [Phenylobacterium sp.]
MKTKIAALSLVLLATTGAAALAQEQDRDRNRETRAEHRGDIGRPGMVGLHRDGQQARPQAESQAQPAPAIAAQPRGERVERDRGDRAARRGPGAPPAVVTPEQRPEPRLAARPPSAEAARQFNGDRDGRRDGGDRRSGPGRDGRDQDRNRDGDRDRGDQSRNWDHNRDRGDRNRNDHGQPRWERGRYPSVFQSPRRFHGSHYRPPAGFGFRAWAYGEILPRAWYASQYRIIDWWAYGLPMPPLGYEWVRSGSDALLVDEWSGRVMQVVRYLFW